MKRSIALASLSAAALAFALCSGAALADEKPLTHADVEAIVKQTLHDNPDLIVKSVEDYRILQEAQAASKAAKNVVTLKSELENDPHSPVIGNPKGDVTLVEFFDYHCGYCKRFFPSIGQLAKDDPNVRIVFKEFPILSEDSRLAAKASLAVYAIDRKHYFEFHSLLMRSNEQFNMDMLEAKVDEAGVDAKAFRKEMQDPALDAEITRNKQLAEQLEISGTPVIIVGGEIMVGAVDLDTLKAHIASVRDTAKGK